MESQRYSIADDRKTILLVDDIPANLELLCSYLGGKYNTAIAKNGEKAIQRAETLRPDIILLDIQMPGIDGYETCRRLKANPVTAPIPVIFMTALTDTINKVRGFEAGGVDYITKPVDGSELLARVETHIALYTMREELKRKNDELELNAKRQKRAEQIMRHDLKSPLQAIFALPDLMLHDSNLTDEQTDIIKCVHQAAKSMLDIINSSLALYKMESRIYSPNLGPVDIQNVLQRVIDSTGSTYSSKRITITVDGTDCTGDRCMVLGEDLLVYILLSNIIKNAIEASPIGETITIRGTSSDQVVLTVTNRGAVPVAIRDTFFDEFTTSGKEHGTGLGTYSAKLICDALKGTITLDSSVEDQTTIAISLPLAK